jgi:hypothetical protein
LFVFKDKMINFAVQNYHSGIIIKTYRIIFMKLKKRWAFLMAAMVLIAIAGLFAKEPSFECDFSNISGADVAWMITATIFVLMMTPGLSFFYGGMVGAKNVISTMLQSFIAMGVITVLWVVFGFSLCFGEDIGGVIGDPTTFLMFQNVGADPFVTATGKLVGGATIPLALFALFQMKFAIITPSLITGSFAERVRFSAYMFFMMWFFVVIYCPLAHMTWHPDGLFLKWGVSTLPVVSWYMPPGCGCLGRCPVSGSSHHGHQNADRPISPSCCWVPPCSGWAGLGSMPAVRCMPMVWP